MSEVRQHLDQFIRAGSVVVIRYNGGSRPGEERAVIPLSLSEEELVAREVGQRQSKQFKLSKIASFRLVDGEAITNPTAIAFTVSISPECETFDEYLTLLTSKRSPLKALGMSPRSKTTLEFARSSKTGNLAARPLFPFSTFTEPRR